MGPRGGASWGGAGGARLEALREGQEKPEGAGMGPQPLRLSSSGWIIFEACLGSGDPHPQWQ